jgi:hypothetical protein
MSKQPSKKIMETREILGDSYSVVFGDFSHAIYRKLNDRYDFEICGLDNTSSTFMADLVIWNITGKEPEQVEIINDIPSLDALKESLDTATAKYS